MEVENVPISEIIPYKDNPRRNDNAIDIVAKSIQEYGFKVPIILDKNNVIIAGHTRLKAAMKLNLLEVPVIWADELTPEQVKAFRIMDNKSHEYADWDLEKLKKELNDLKDTFDLDLTGFNETEIYKILDRRIKEDYFEIPNEPKYKIELGDIYQLGEHKLICGDSNKSDIIGKLIKTEKIKAVITDPPYNTGMDKKINSGSTWLNHMFNDNFTDEEWNIFLDKMLESINSILPNDSVAYIFHDWRGNYKLIPKIKKYFTFSNLIVWDKVVHGLGSDYKYTHEFINVCKKGKPTLKTHQNEEYKDIWHIQRKIGKNKFHATVKPVELISRIIKHCSNEGDNILDMFGGSGTTIIACEQLNRKCFMMEIDPQYCSIIIERWEKFTGKKAKKIG